MDRQNTAPEVHPRVAVMDINFLSKKHIQYLKQLTQNNHFYANEISSKLNPQNESSFVQENKKAQTNPQYCKWDGFFVLKQFPSEDDCEICAFCIFHYNTMILSIEFLMVDVDSRKQNIGKMIIDHIKYEASEKNIQNLTVYLEEDRQDIHQFYLKNGFYSIETMIEKADIPNMSKIAIPELTAEQNNKMGLCFYAMSRDFEEKEERKKAQLANVSRPHFCRLYFIMP